MNIMERSDFDGIREVVWELLGKCGERVMVNLPFYCDYGFRIEVGRTLASFGIAKQSV
jgi:maltose O-acetyltransferase